MESKTEVITVVCSENWDPIAAIICFLGVSVITLVHCKWLMWE